VLRYLSLIFVLMFMSNLGAAQAFGNSIISRPENKGVYYPLFRLHYDEVTSVKVQMGAFWNKTLTIDEMHTLIGLLNKIRKNEIEPYIGPSPKGAALYMTLLLKSGEVMSFIVNADYILHEGIQAYQPEIWEFLKQVRRKQPH
jgi:hypothetical protein